MSTFHGLEMAKQALFAQQSALYTTGHNISNANTDGYSRQRVNFDTLSPFPPASRNRPEIPGQMGTGVEIGTIQRVRNKFLDIQYRSENSRMNYWDTRSNALSRMERLMNEPSDSGLSKTMDSFWQSLEDLSVNPEQPGARSVVAERARAMTETFNYLSDSLQSIQSDLKEEIDGTADRMNSILRQIHQINEQIRTIEPHGYLTNDLYDDRDRLIDELSEIASIEVTYHASEGGALEIADGIVEIELVDKSGASLEPKVTLLEHDAEYEHNFEFISINHGDAGVEGISINTSTGDLQAIEIDEFINNTTGSLNALIEAYGYEADGAVIGEYPYMLERLDALAYEFANRFNEVHSEGFNINDDDDNADRPFFIIPDDVNGTAGSIRVNDEILNDPTLINAGYAEDGQEFPGNGENALRLADVFDETINGEEGSTEGLGGSPREYIQATISELGIRAQEANRMTNNTTILRSQVEEQRMSVSGVSLDEEMSNMIKFQHAYNAAARNMTAIDEMIDRIINNMGLVGR